MSTTYSNPKEMLGYIVVKFIDQQLPLLQNIPYDKRAVFAFYYQLRGLDVQLITFREDMSLDLAGQQIDYKTAKEEINEILRANWQNVHAKDHESFLGALFTWAELIASCYPKLGLVPESETNIDDKRENMIEPVASEMEELPNDIVESPGPVTKEEFERITRNKQPEPGPVSRGPELAEPVVETNPVRDAERDKQRELRRQAYRLL